MSIKLIVGLKNPGASYAYTRHNAGEWFIQAYAEKAQLNFTLQNKFQSNVSAFKVNDETIYVALPTTFMNHSGQAVRALSQFYRIQPHEILIVHDELDLDVGCIRLKTGGGHGGHNGLRDIINQLGSRDFHRLRIGIGHPGQKELVIDYVLSKPSLEDKNTIIDSFHSALEMMPLLLAGRLSDAMTQLNKG